MTDEERAADYLQDILESIDLVEAYTLGVDRSAFLAWQEKQDAVVRRIEISGEAARRVPEGIRAGYPQVPWPHVIGTRNRLIHAYDSVDYEPTWQIVVADLPALKRQMAQILDDLGRPKP